MGEMSEWENEWHKIPSWRELEAWMSQNQKPSMWLRVTYTTTTTSDRIPYPPESKTYTDGFDDGWTARGVADGKPK